MNILIPVPWPNSCRYSFEKALYNVSALPWMKTSWWASYGIKQYLRVRWLWSLTELIWCHTGNRTSADQPDQGCHRSGTHICWYWILKPTTSVSLGSSVLGSLLATLTRLCGPSSTPGVRMMPFHRKKWQEDLWRATNLALSVGKK